MGLEVLNTCQIMTEPAEQGSSQFTPRKEESDFYFIIFNVVKLYVIVI